MSECRGIVVGMLVALGKHPKPEDLIDCMRSAKVKGMGLSADGYRELATCMIVEGFGGNAEDFLLALRQNTKSQVPGNSDAPVLPQYSQAAVAMIREELEHGRHRRRKTLEALVGTWLMFADNRGKTGYLLRSAAKQMDVEDVDKFAESLPEYDVSVLNILASGIIEQLGTWRIWKMICRFFLGKKPYDGDAELSRQRRIAVLQATLEGSWMHKITLDTAGQRIMDAESKLMDELRQIDETANKWIEENMPDWRKGAKD